MENFFTQSVETAADQASRLMKTYKNGGKKTMTQEHKEKIARAMADRKIRRKSNHLFLDLGDIRIVRVDDICLAVEMKRNKVWDLRGYYGSPWSAIQKALNLTLDINQRSTIAELLKRFNEVSVGLLGLASVQVKQFEHDADAKHAKMRGGKK